MPLRCAVGKDTSYCADYSLEKEQSFTISYANTFKNTYKVSVDASESRSSLSLSS